MQIIDWDAAHEVASVALVGHSTAKQYHDVFNQVGLFSAAAEYGRVVEVGPGLGNFLASLPSHQRNAIEVSSVNRRKLREAGIVEACAPGDLSRRGLPFANVGVALSVFQHCEDAAVEQLFADLRGALLPDAALYCNSISVPPGFVVGADAGVVSRSLEALQCLARGFELVRSTTSPAEGMPFLHHIARFVRV